MKLILENIGMLKKAEITLNQLVVIAGENDNGKSTIGKVIFCLVKAINRYKEDLQESKDYKINESFNELFFLLRRSMPVFNEELESSFKKLRDLVSVDMVHENESVEYKDAVNTIRSAARTHALLLPRLDEILNEINRTIREPENVKKSIENALNKVFASEFDSSVLFIGEQTGSIKLFENAIKLLDIKISEGNKISLESEVEPIELKDATFIESPLILNNHDLLIRSISGLDLKKRSISKLGMPYTTLHTKDLFDKLQEPSLEGLFSSDVDEDFRLKLNEIINGEVHYDNKVRDFVFKRGQDLISIKNTASGVKVFGLLQLLLRNDFMNKHTVFIFDEPENHLHPNWQLKLAKILVELSKQGIYILVSSHSPYMIEALKRFSDKAAMIADTGFYLAENNAIDNRNRLEDIFRILSEPFEIFRKMDSEELGFE